MKRQVFFGFHFGNAVWRVGKIRNYERLALSRNKNDVMRLANEGVVPQKPEDILHTTYWSLQD